MSALYPVLLVAIPALLLAALLRWVYAGKRKERLTRESAVAKTNHESVRKFHYGPAPAPEPLAAAPVLAPDNLLSQLLPEEDFRANEEKEAANEADRAEAEQVAEREAAQTLAPLAVAPAAAAGAAAGKPIPALVEEPAAVLAGEPVTVPAAGPAGEPMPVLRSSRHAPGATVNVFDVLGLLSNDAAAAGGSTVSEPASAAAPLTAAPTMAASTAAGTAGDSERVAQAIYDNALTEPTGTKNDVANRQAAAELRKRRRAAFQAGTDGQKTALTALITETNAPL